MSNLHTNHYVRLNRVTDTKKRGKSKLIVSTYKRKRDEVLRDAREFKRKQGLKFVDGEPARLRPATSPASS